MGGVDAVEGEAGEGRFEGVVAGQDDGVAVGEEDDAADVEFVAESDVFRWSSVIGG